MRNFTLLISLLLLTWSATGQDGWTQVDSGLPSGKGIGQISVGMDDNTALWAMAINADGSIYDAFTRSTDGGQTWEAGTFDAGSSLSQLFAIDANVCWAVFNSGATQGLYKTEDGGVTWVRKSAGYGSSSFANLMHFFDDMNGFAQGDPVDGYFELYTTTDGGETWTRVPEANIPAPLSGEYGITGNYCAVGDNIWFGTNSARIYRSNDKGYTWQVSDQIFFANDSTTVETIDALMWDDMNGIAYRSYLNLGYEPYFNVTSDGGATWTEIFANGVNYARYLTLVPGTTNTIVGSSGSASDNGMGISISYDGGANWEIITDGYSFLATAWLDMETGWAGTDATSSGGGMYIYGNPPAPTNLQATVDNDYDYVNLSWSPPMGAVTELIYDDNTTTGAYSYNGYTMSLHMSPAGPCQVLAMKFYTTVDPANDVTFNATLFGWEGTQPGTDIVYMETATAVDEDWMEVDISDQDIMFDGDFVVGFGSINDSTYLGFDGNLDNGRSWDFDNTGQTWSAWNEAYLVRAIVEYTDGSVAVLGGSTTNAPKFTSRSISKLAHPNDHSHIQTVDPVSNRSQAGLELLGYNIYRNGSKINSETVATEEYTDMDAPVGALEYYVTALYAGGESDPSDTAYVVVTDVYDNVDDAISLYPNPVTDILTIESPQNIQLITITNSVGQMVYHNQFDAGKTQINMGDFQSGVYLIRINTEKSKMIKKIIIE